MKLFLSGLLVFVSFVSGQFVAPPATTTLENRGGAVTITVPNLVVIPSRIATDVDQLEFDNAYWASMPPPVQKLRDEQDYDKRKMMGAILADYNYRIDNAIMVWGWDPYNVMKLRLSFGYTWTPIVGQSPVQVAPGLGLPGNLAPYDPKTPTPHAFKVSLDFADYPPFVG